MTQKLKVAVLVNPLTLQSKGGRHPLMLGTSLQARGHTVRGFGAPSSSFPGLDQDSGEAGGVAAFGADVIIAYDALSPAAWVGARNARKLEVPLVLIEAGFVGDGPLHSRFLRRTGEAMWGRYIRNTAALLCALDPFAAELAESEGFAPERVHLLPGGVDLDRYKPGIACPEVHKHRVPGRILSYIGKVDEHRGLEILIEAFARTVGQGRDWSLLLAGEGPSRRRLRAMSDRLGIGARVHWLAGPTREQLPGLMCASTLLAVPAIDSSVRGKQIPRAMACGIPVLVSDLPRFRALCRDDDAGLVVPPGDVKAWTEALKRACGSPMSRKRWGDRGRELAEQRLSWDGIAERFERLVADARPVTPETGEDDPLPGLQASGE